MNWSGKRKLVYGLALFFSIVAILLYLFKDVLFPSPTCNDKKQNGGELGVDCGGICSLRCQEEVKPLTVTFAKAIKASQTTYDLVGMVSNKNVDNASRSIGYVFTVYDAFGEVIATTTGRSLTPVDGDFPVIVENITLPKSPTTVEMSLIDGYHYKVFENPVSPTVKVSEIRYEGGATPHVYANVKNTKRLMINNLPVLVVLYDEQGNVYAVGKTFVQFLDKEQTKAISFVWRTSFVSAPVKIRVYPILDPFTNQSN